MYRPLLNGSDLVKWACDQGFSSILPLDDLHVTIAFSRDKVDWSLTDRLDNVLEIEGGERKVEALGNKGAVVLRFEAPALHERWAALREDLGCSWDFPDYKTHLSITYAGKDLDPDDMEPFPGVLRFGAEVFEPLDDEWSNKAAETALR